MFDFNRSCPSCGCCHYNGRCNRCCLTKINSDHDCDKCRFRH